MERNFEFKVKLDPEKVHDPHYDKQQENSLSYERMQEKQRLLRRWKSWIENRQKFIELERGVIEKMTARQSAPEKIAAVAERIQSQEAEIAELQQMMRELGKQIGDDFTSYNKLEKKFLEAPGPSKLDN